MSFFRSRDLNWIANFAQITSTLHVAKSGRGGYRASKHKLHNHLLDSLALHTEPNWNPIQSHLPAIEKRDDAPRRKKSAFKSPARH